MPSQIILHELSNTSQTTHDDVKKRILKIIDGWVKEHGKNPDFEL